MKSLRSLICCWSWCIAVAAAGTPLSPAATGSTTPRLVPIAGSPMSRAARDMQAPSFAERMDRRGQFVRALGQRPLPDPSRGVAGRLASARNVSREPDTLRVLLVRIAFEADVSGDLTSVTTDGDFQYEPDPTVLVDPPPHDKAYFEAHLAGTAEYWHSMSNGRLVVESQVVPPAAQSAYYLSDIADYGPGAGGFWTLEGLLALTDDMIAAADEGTQQDGSAILADWDDDDPLTWIVFAHAGSDWQSDLAGDSPNDIPSFWVTYDEARTLTSIDSETGLPGSLSQLSVIPETTSQDGYVGAIAALLANQTGHGLGLPDLYDTTTGLPGVGIWDLMDSGLNVVWVVGWDTPGGIVVEYVTGLLPTSIGIWGKHFLGWVETDVVDAEARDVTLLTAHVPTPPGAGAKAIEVVVDEDRRLLLENRWVPPFHDGYYHVDDATGVVQYLANADGTNSHLYDLALLPAGLLAWHVKQDLVAARLATNTLQQGTDRAVEIVEADGVQGIGTGVGGGFFGSDDDAFRDQSSFEDPWGTIVVYGATATDLHGGFGFPEVWVSEIPGSWGDPMVFRVADSPVAVPDSPAVATPLAGPVLERNAPNPFNPRTTLAFATPEAGSVRLRIFDLGGRLVATLVDGQVGAGRHEVVWNGRDAAGRGCPSGVYVARLEAAGTVVHGHLNLVR